MPFARKVLWIVSLDNARDEQQFLAHIRAAGIDTACIRTDSPQFPDVIDHFHKAGLKVWGWRWPGVKPNPHGTYYAINQANFVKDTLIPAGLDGYIVDPESDKGSPNNDWNDAALAPIAEEFCRIIKDAAKGKPFVFGTTSGCTFPSPGGKPNIPWKEFFTASDVLYPQTYWRAMIRDEHDNKEKPTDIHGGTPAESMRRGFAAWQPPSLGKPLMPMAGEIDLVTKEEIAAYGAELVGRGVTEAHFYADNPNVKAEILAAIRAL